MKRVTESALIELSEGHITNGLLEGFNRKFIMADNKAWIGYFANDLRDGPVMVLWMANCILKASMMRVEKLGPA